MACTACAYCTRDIKAQQSLLAKDPEAKFGVVELSEGVKLPQTGKYFNSCFQHTFRAQWCHLDHKKKVDNNTVARNASYERVNGPSSSSFHMNRGRWIFSSSFEKGDGYPHPPSTEGTKFF
ncbi:hypothetical protein JTB14_030178 [Gonioctena quinquepunctata]|nr:hypothetical protein JTB14_030178 [Gonioctena quinquepunctata]